MHAFSRPGGAGKTRGTSPEQNDSQPEQPKATPKCEKRSQRPYASRTFDSVSFSFSVIFFLDPPGGVVFARDASQTRNKPPRPTSSFSLRFQRVPCTLENPLPDSKHTRKARSSQNHTSPRSHIPRSRRLSFSSCLYVSADLLAPIIKAEVRCRN